MKRRGWISLSAVMAMAITTVTWAQNARLGTIDFPTSTTSEQAHAYFLEGVGMLHSFEWVDAAEAFQKAREVDPDFVMAYWGEALSHTGGHHFPPVQDMSKAREVLRSLAPTRGARLAKASTERERAYLEAVELLYGPGNTQERANAYSEAMGKLHQQYPEDMEAATLYGLSLMRTVRRGEGSIRQDMKAGAIAQSIYRENPDHPGAAHYIIHAYDDPVHAPLALYAAHKYANIAPDAVHALHMPAHIFVQSGMWSHVAASNEKSYQASVTRVERKGLSPTRRSFHALYWLQYAYLQQGRYDKAQECIGEIRSVADRQDTLDDIKERLARMEALHTVEVGHWRATDLDELLGKIDKDASSVNSQTAGAVLFASGMSAVKTGDLEAAELAEDGLEKLHDHMRANSYRGMNQIAIMHKEMAALVRLARGQDDDAVELMEQATAISETMPPPSGPPGESNTDPPIKPSHELFGEVLLELERPEEAAAQFDASLLRMPKRPRSLLGAARAAVKMGDRKAALRYYEELTKIPGAEKDLPGLEEAKSYQKKAGEGH